MWAYSKLFLLLNSINFILSKADIIDDDLTAKVISTKNHMFWPNGTIPFYINLDDFDKEQSLLIMTALSKFAYKTCLKFLPVLETPVNNSRVMTFINPNGDRRCKINPKGNSVYENFKVTLGYECLKSPNIEMIIMKALGFPFEHNRLCRDLYINVMLENVEASAIDLFTKDIALPQELRALPYDINSVMHFGERQYSKNGHKTISFKGANTKQHREGLTDSDIKKIQIVYGEECLKRDRLEKVEICQSYPGIVRRKRQTETGETVKSLRVNPNITPPPPISKPIVKLTGENLTHNNVTDTLKRLGIDEEAQTVVDNVFKLSSAALLHAREKMCKDIKDPVSLPSKTKEKSHNNDIVGILELIADYAIETVEKAVSNLTIFCETPDVLAAYQRTCDWRTNDRCKPTYRSTKTGDVFYSTKHRPYIRQSTNLERHHKYSYDRPVWRSGNNTDDTTGTTPQIQVRRKREAIEAKKSLIAKEKLQKEKMNVKEKTKAKPAARNGTKDDVAASGVKRQFFKRRSYKTKKGAIKPESQWASSDVSSEGGTDVVSAARGKEIADVAEVNDVTPPNLKKEIKVNQDTSDFGKRVHFISKEKSIVDGNGVEETSQDDSDADVSTAKEKVTKSKNKIKTKDTYEIMDKKLVKTKSLKQEQNGDDDLPNTVLLTRLNKEFYHERRWPEGVVRYVISPLETYDLDDMRARLGAVAEILKRKTCVRLEEVTEEEAMNHEDYLVLDTSPDYITGRVGGQQHFGCIELFKGGQHKQHAAMMVMAMLGFYFEVSRHDRDKYIRVHMRHVRPDKLHHFEKIRDEATLDLPYDFESATHPAWQFWRKIGKTGISTVATYRDQDPDGSIMRSLGQHDQLLSDSDITKINSVYGIECFTENDNRRSLNKS